MAYFPFRRTSAVLMVTVGNGVAGVKPAARGVNAAPGPSRILFCQFPPLTLLSQRCQEKVRLPVSSSLPACFRSPNPNVFTFSSMFADQFRHGSSLLRSEERRVEKE